jgi:hypothetical protein
MKYIIYVDSQAAIKGINKPGKQSGQSNLISAITKIQTLVDERQMVVEIIWVPGHEDVDGNEKVDKAAKEAAKSEGSDETIPRSPHSPLISTRSACIKQEVAKDWNESWQFQVPNRDAKLLRRITKRSNITQSHYQDAKPPNSHAFGPDIAR